jgi:outer membrane immunogenic protein
MFHNCHSKFSPFGITFKMNNASSPRRSMKKLFLISTALVAFAGASPVFAADLSAAPVYKGPVAAPVPMYNWSGFYIGGNLGGEWLSSQTSILTQFTPTDAYRVGTSLNQLNTSAFVGGAQGGFNWQFSNWVIGFEGDYIWSHDTGSATTQSIVVPSISATVDATGKSLELAAGRVGYAWNNWLFYVKGGGAWEQASATSETFRSSTLIDTTSTNIDRSGWTIGGGIEWGFWANWSAKIEYNYIDFGTQTFTSIGTSGAIAGLSALRNSSATVDLIRAGVNYRFNWWSPSVVPRY